MKWRKDNCIDNILSESQDHFDNIKEFYPHYFHGRSLQGLPVYYELAGKIDLKKLYSHGIDVNSLLRYYVFMSEYLWKHIEPNDDGQLISILGNVM